MIIVRNTFIAKPGQASKLAAQFKKAAAAAELPNFRVLTDLTGDFNRVVLAEAGLGSMLPGLASPRKMALLTQEDAHGDFGILPHPSDARRS
jgi:hypothetical protein